MWKYSWREIIRRKNRSLAAILSYTLAVIVFSLLISLLQESDLSMNKTLQNTGTHFIAFRPVCCNLPQLRDVRNEGFWANGTRSAVLSTQILDEVKKLPSVSDASAMLMFLFQDSIRHVSFTVAGFMPENNISVANTTCASTDLIEGRYISSSDTNEVMIEHSYAISRVIHVGDSIRIADKYFRVKGIVNAGIRPVKADVYMPFSQAESAISTRTWNPLKDQMNIILVESVNAHVHTQAMQDVKNLLGKDNIVSSYACHKPAASALDLNRYTLLFASILMVLFVFIHVIRNQYASVVERKREIGILHSIGWSNSNISLFVVDEFITQTMIGGIGGCIFATVYQFSTQTLTTNTFMISMTGFCVIVLTSIISGFIVVSIVLRKRPTNNLRTL